MLVPLAPAHLHGDILQHSSQQGQQQVLLGGGEASRGLLESLSSDELRSLAAEELLATAAGIAWQAATRF